MVEIVDGASIVTNIQIVVVAIIAAAAGIYAAKKTRESNKESYSERLIARVEVLETKMEKTQIASRLAFSYIEKVFYMWKTGQLVDDFPTPPIDIHEYLDPAIWEKRNEPNGSR